MTMKQGKPKIRRVKLGDTLARQGKAATDFYPLVDSVITIDVDGNQTASLGPGAFIGERAALDARPRTITLTAATRCKGAQAGKVEFQLEKLADSEGHRGEETLRC